MFNDRFVRWHALGCKIPVGRRVISSCTLRRIFDPPISFPTREFRGGHRQYEHSGADRTEYSRYGKRVKKSYPDGLVWTVSKDLTAVRKFSQSSSIYRQRATHLLHTLDNSERLRTVTPPPGLDISSNYHELSKDVSADDDGNDDRQSNDEAWNDTNVTIHGHGREDPNALRDSLVHTSTLRPVINDFQLDPQQLQQQLGSDLPLVLRYQDHYQRVLHSLQQLATALEQSDPHPAKAPVASEKRFDPRERVRHDPQAATAVQNSSFPIKAKVKKQPKGEQQTRSMLRRYAEHASHV